MRKETPSSGGGEHGDPGDGYEVVPQNIGPALDGLMLDFDSFHEQDAAKPQSTAFLGWLKNSLANKAPVVAFVLCAGDEHNAYNLGTFDHIEPFWGLYSNHDLMDPSIYPDDYIVHGSDYGPDGDANLGYFRRMTTMVDTVKMDGNCKQAQPIWKKNEMYPCFDEQENFGTAIKGLRDPLKLLMPLYITSDIIDEPNIRTGAQPIDMNLLIYISDLKVGTKYELKKFKYDEWPHHSEFAAASSSFAYSIAFVATRSEWTIAETIMGNGQTLSSETAYFACFEIPLNDTRPTVD